MNGLRINDFVKLLILILIFYYIGIMFKKILFECCIFVCFIWLVCIKVLIFVFMIFWFLYVDINVMVGIEIFGMENLKLVSSIEIIFESGCDVNIYFVRG